MRNAPHHLLVFRSSHGGSGQTTLSAHVALGLARSGRQVLMVEEGLPGMARHYLQQHAPAQPGSPGAPGSPGSNGSRLVESVAPNLAYAAVPELTADVLASLAAEDHGRQSSWIVADTSRFAAADLDADLEVHVLRADPASLVSDALLGDAASAARFVLNQVDHRRPVSRDIDYVLGTLLGDRLLCRVHHDEALPEALARGSNVFDSAPTSRAAAALTELVDLVIAEEAQPKSIVASRSE